MNKLKHGLVFWATLTLTIPNNVVNRSTAAFCANFAYAPVIDGKANPETPIQFTQRMIAEWVKQIVISYEMGIAVRSSADMQRAATISDVSGIK